MINANYSAGAKSYAFVVTKPLQLMVVMAILEQLPVDIIKDLILVDGFIGAEEVSERIAATSSKWDGVIFLSKVDDVIGYIKLQRYDWIFIDSDVGIRKYLQLLGIKLIRPQTKISVYEEGLGSYRTDIYAGVKKVLLKYTGVGVYFGGCWLTENIYLYVPDEYIKKTAAKKNKTIKILKTIPDLFGEHNKWFASVFGLLEIELALLASPRKNNCIIYLTSWSWDYKTASDLCRLDAYKILKFHPHIREQTKEIIDFFDFSASATVPAEFLVIMASTVFEKVTVYHHGTSVERYLKLKNVQFTKITN